MPAVLRLALAGSLAAIAAGCPNPAADKPRATVGAAEPAASGAPAGALEAVAVSTADSKIGFVGAKVTGKHEGGFSKFGGTVEVPPRGIEGGRVTIDIDTTSVFSDAPKLTAHLRSADFFDVDRWPRATFVSTSIAPRAGASDEYTVSGTLDFHGVKKPIAFPAKIAALPDAVTATSEFSLDRKAFGIAYPGKSDDLIRDDVVVRLSLRAPRKTAPSR